MFPGFDKISCFSEPGATRAFRGSLREDKGDRDYFQILCGETQVVPPIVVHPYGGRQLADFIWTDHTSVVLISSRAESAFRGSRLSGWKTYPVAVFDRNRDRINGPVGLAITGRCSAIEWSRSTPVLRAYPTGTFRDFRGMFFQERSWDGSDFFMPAGSAWVLASPRVREVIEAHALKNAKLVRLTQIEVSGFVVDPTLAGGGAG